MILNGEEIAVYLAFKEWITSTSNNRLFQADPIFLNQKLFLPIFQEDGGTRLLMVDEVFSPDSSAKGTVFAYHSFEEATNNIERFSFLDNLRMHLVDLKQLLPLMERDKKDIDLRISFGGDDVTLLSDSISDIFEYYFLNPRRISDSRISYDSVSEALDAPPQLSDQIREFINDALLCFNWIGSYEVTSGYCNGELLHKVHIEPRNTASIEQAKDSLVELGRIFHFISSPILVSINEKCFEQKRNGKKRPDQESSPTSLFAPKSKPGLRSKFWFGKSNPDNGGLERPFDPPTGPSR